MRKEDALKDRISTPVHSETVSEPIISFKCTQDDLGTRLLPVSRDKVYRKRPPSHRIERQIHLLQVRLNPSMFII